MLSFVVRRILLMIPTLFVISMLVFVIIQLPPGDYLASYIAELQAQGESVRSAEDRVPARAVRPRPAAVAAVPALGRRPAPGRLRLLVRVQPAGNGGDRRPAVADPSWSRSPPSSSPGRSPSRSASIRRPTSTAGRLRAHAPRLPRPRDAELPAGAGAALSRQRLVRHVDRRPDGPGVHRPAEELGQVSARCSSISGSR